MLLNAMEKIDTSAGKYVVLVDYGSEGIGVWSQFEELSEAIKATMSASCIAPTAIVKVVAISLDESF